MKVRLGHLPVQLLHAGRRCLLLLLCLSCWQPVVAQVWRLDTSLLDLETGSPITMATLDLELLGLLSVGDNFDVYVEEDQKYNIHIDEINVMGNGDRRWYGSINNTGLDYSLVITAGTRTAHLILTSPSGIFQLYGSSDNGLYFTGRFNRLEHVRDEVATADTILPPPDEENGSLPEFSSEAIAISQSVSETVAPAGSALTFELTITNQGTTALFSQYVDIFFVLENTSLVQLPVGCDVLQSTDMEPVLGCELGDFGMGEQKQLSYTVVTSMASHPLVYSTATVGDIRSDVIVEIYRDVTSDWDNDGISDYNEELLGTDPLTPNDDTTAYIDVLVAYTEGVNDYYLGEVDTRINQLFNVANKIFADSRAGIVLRPVGAHEVAYQPADELFTDLSTVTFQSDDALNDLSRLRSLYGGDLMVLFRTGEVNGLCGLANLGGKGTQADLSADYHKDFAVSVINIDCMDDSVLAHEIGHNLGLVHSRREDPDGGTLPYAAGFGVDTRFVSVMAFPDDFDVVNRLYRFSDPHRACGPFPCGENKEDQSNGADAVSSMKLVKHQVANYFPSQEDRITALDTISSEEGPIAATVGVAAYSPLGSGFNTSFPDSETVNLRMKITPLPRQVGGAFVPHIVVLSDRNRLYQATETGELVSWNGSLDALLPAGNPRVLGDRDLFDIVRAIDLESVNLLNRNLHVYIAYRMVDTGELVYGTKPFVFRVNTESAIGASMPE